MTFSEWLLYYFTDPRQVDMNTRMSHAAAAVTVRTTTTNHTSLPLGLYKGVFTA